jgi:hypothetical protein
LPEWIGNPETGEGGNFGMRWIKEPHSAANSKKPTCIINNRWGNQSKITLESLTNEDEVEYRFKSKEYSCIWVNELSKFTDRKTLDTLKFCFRMPHLKPWEHLLLCDTNPAEEGKESYIFKMWYELANASDEQLAEILPEMDPKVLIPLRRSLKLIEFSVDDNLALSQEQKDNLLASLAHDPDLVERYWHGRWVTASTDALFYQVFRPHHHVIPEYDKPAGEDEIMLPQQNCSALITGWDPGDSMNSACVIAEKCSKVVDQITTEDGETVDVERPLIKYLDEVVKVGASHNLEEFTLEVMRRMQFWEATLGLRGKTRWTHWSDRSVFERQATESQRYLAQVIYEASARAILSGEILISGPIILEAADRSPGSLSGRIDLFKRLLFESRMLFSRRFCPKLIEAVKSIKRPNNWKPGSGILIQKGTRHKHPFDAASYLASSECHEEMNRAVMNEVRRARKSKGSLVTVAF